MYLKLNLGVLVLCLSAPIFASSSIPEPMVFDLIRALDSKKGELEINTLAHKSYKANNTNLSIDPFGSGATTFDNQKIEWAPEIEYAIADGFAVEFEIPMEGRELEAYKFGMQYTFGKINESYIHGMQILLETNDALEKPNKTVLYLGGYRFDEMFSTLFMLGGRMDLEGKERTESFEYLANGSFFAQLNHTLVLGLEANYSRNKNGEYALGLIPQIHYETNDNIEIQIGLSFGNSSYAEEKAVVLRAIYCF